MMVVRDGNLWWGSEITIATMIGDYCSLNGIDIGKVCIGSRSAMSTAAPGDIASANRFYLRTLCMN